MANDAGSSRATTLNPPQTDEKDLEDAKDLEKGITDDKGAGDAVALKSDKKLKNPWCVRLLDPLLSGSALSLCAMGRAGDRAISAFLRARGTSGEHLLGVWWLFLCSVGLLVGRAGGDWRRAMVASRASKLLRIGSEATAERRLCGAAPKYPTAGFHNDVRARGG